ncbi:unnamed protein product [Bemisia tabaci]|uniref:Ionotropic receptor n=1 Tax=Bemisia tabaci TaxID=7038 RepID=A0A9P0F842_BEMTA|nr:unnamed protein product [Bemisia tabaci]
MHFALEVCKKILSTSKHPHMHVVNLNAKQPVGRFLRVLHTNAVSTTLTDYPGNLNESIGKHGSKNIFFFVQNFSDIFGVIFDSVSQEKKSEVGIIPRSDLQNSYDINHLQEKCTLRKYCIEYDLGPINIGPNGNETCDVHLYVTSKELVTGSTITDQVFNYTRRLFVNDIWNHKNYITFFISNPDNHGLSDGAMSIRSGARKDSSPIGMDQKFERTLLFSFRFFWRFFKGQRVLICTENTCFRYDPFAAKIHQYFSSKDETFFDFTYEILQTYNVRCLFHPGTDTMTEQVFWWFTWWDVLMSAIYDVMHFQNLTFTYETLPEEPSDFKEFELALKVGVDLYVSPVSSMYDTENNAVLDNTVAIDTCTVCIGTPRPGYKPQLFVPFHAFSPPVWAVLIVTIAFFLIVQYVFQYSQYTIFKGLYSETELLIFEETPIALTIFSYFMCGCPVRALLGRLFTGKIIFCVLSFAVLIIGSVFQNGMFTLLSRYVRYADIDTLDELRDSDILIQSREVATNSTLFDQHPEFADLKEKLVTNYAYYKDVLDEIVEYENTTYYGAFLALVRDLDQSMMDADRIAEVSSILEKATSAKASDAFVFSLPSFLISRKNFMYRSHMSLRAVEFHHVQECFFTYPVIFRVLKNFFFFDALNDRLLRIFETGRVDMLENEVGEYTEKYLTGEQMEDLPRVFTMRDFELAFMGLGVGLFISFFIFLGEVFNNLSN